MKKLKFKYFFEEDVLYISLSNKKSAIGDEDYQENVVLYRSDDAKEIIGIEILNFTHFKENKIKIKPKDCIDFSFQFQKIKMFISLRDIMYNDPQQFEETLREWGFIKAPEANRDPNHLFLSLPQQEMSTHCSV